MTTTRIDTQTGLDPPGPARGLPEVDADAVMPSEQRGRLVRFVAERGFGFIARYGEPDLFFHTTGVLDRNIPVKVGQQVCFRVEPNAGKPGFFMAVEVRRITLAGHGNGEM